MGSIFSASVYPMPSTWSTASHPLPRGGTPRSPAPHPTQIIHLQSGRPDSNRRPPAPKSLKTRCEIAARDLLSSTGSARSATLAAGSHLSLSHRFGRKAGPNGRHLDQPAQDVALDLHAGNPVEGAGVEAAVPLLFQGGLRDLPDGAQQRLPCPESPAISGPGPAATPSARRVRNARALQSRPLEWCQAAPRYRSSTSGRRCSGQSSPARSCPRSIPGR